MLTVHWENAFSQSLVSNSFHFMSQGYASRGYVAIAIDARYHGERASSTTAYRNVGISPSA